VNRVASGGPINADPGALRTSSNRESLLPFRHFTWP
jgi:hypothetical protein